MRVIKVIDRFTSLCVYLVMLLLVPMILANVVEVLMRYVMGSPTTWATDVTVMSYGSLFMLGSAYAMLKGAHVRTDIFFEGFSRSDERHHRRHFVLVPVPSRYGIYLCNVH